MSAYCEQQLLRVAIEARRSAEDAESRVAKRKGQTGREVIGKTKRRNHWSWIAALAVVSLAGAAAAAPGPGPRVAYIDPGAGSFLLQALVAALAGIIVTANVYWAKIKKLLGFGTDPENTDKKASPQPGDE